MQVNCSFDKLITNSWANVLSEEFKSEYFLQLSTFLNKEFREQMIFPPKNMIFNAYNLTPPEKVKVVILGQDPYHNEDQAHGLSFSVKTRKLPPSLKNIFSELNDDLDLNLNTNGDLTNWANQGVLLLNATLTVRAHQPGSHQKMGWETFTDRTIQYLSSNYQGIVFMLWGNFAQKKSILIDGNKHLVLCSTHPSPFSARKGFFGCKHFSKANNYLIKRGTTPIKWSSN